MDASWRTCRDVVNEGRVRRRVWSGVEVSLTRFMRRGDGQREGELPRAKCRDPFRRTSSSRPQRSRASYRVL
jgi:hypothetical protein